MTSAVARSLVLITACDLCNEIMAADDPVPSLAAQSGLLKSEFIFDQAPFHAAHASTIVETSAGNLIAAWFGGSRERALDVSIWSARYDGGGWSEPIKIAEGIEENGLRRYACWNPVLFQPKFGPLLLFYKVGPSPESWWGL